MSAPTPLETLRLAVWRAFDRANGIDPAGYVPVNAALDAYEAAAREEGREQGRREERAEVVAFLRSEGPGSPADHWGNTVGGTMESVAADIIERGDHVAAGRTK